MRTELLASVSHDIKTPLNGIMGMTEIAKGNQDKPEVVRDCLDKISLTSKYMLHILNEVLDISAIEKGTVHVKEEPFDLKQVLDETVAVMEGYAVECGVKLVTDYKTLTHPWLLGDEVKLRRILLNLLSNAIKFTPSGGKVELRVHEKEIDNEKTEYIFEVEDDGVGIDEEMQAYLFEPFKKGGNEVHTKYAGIGLGMTIVKNYVELIGGKIMVKSGTNKGSKFTAVTTFRRDKAKGKKKLAKEAKKAGLIGMRVLIADDNELNLLIMRELLEELGVEVVTVTNGFDALNTHDCAEGNHFDALLLDILMPGLLGTEVAYMLRNADFEGKDVPIIALTARNEEEVIKQVRAVGMNDYILKPVSQQDIIRVLSKYYTQPE